MAKCTDCGQTFNVAEAASEYEEYCHRQWGGVWKYDIDVPDHDLCAECAEIRTETDMAAGEEIKELMGDSWYDD